MSCPPLAAMLADESSSLVKPNLKAAFLSSRAGLMALIRTAVLRSHIGRQAYFLALNYLDEVMARVVVPAKDYPLVALCCLFLACKPVLY